MNHRLAPIVSRRQAVAGIGAVGIGLAAGRAAAQSSAHALVGTWYVGLPGDQSGPSPTVATYFADGNVVVYAAAGPRPYTWQGVWEATGPTSARMTIVSSNVAEDGSFTGNNIIAGTIELDPAGDRFTNKATYTAVDQHGNAMGSPADAPGVGFRLKVTTAGAATPTS